MGPLTSVDELRDRSGDRLHGVTLLDVRYRLGGPSTRPEYAAGHLPGARFVDLDRDLARPPNEHGRHPLPAAADLEAVMRGLGVDDDRPVVCYDFADGLWAARAWWVLRYFGHLDVTVLDGGYAAWVAAGGEISRDESARVGSFTARPGGMPLLDAREAAATARGGVLLDARASERYAGRSEPIDPVAGHIPGAVSLPTLGNVDVTGHFLDPDVLRRRFAGVGLGDAKVAGAGVYCGSGVTAAHEVLAIELAGLGTPALYADSWSGWITDPDRPIATGDAPG
jgi:thiosulfate/3-mercaptopyruvate sulfurtransferase